MLLALLGALAAAPLFWFVVPAKARKDYLAAASIVGLSLYDVRLPVLVLGLIVLLFAATRYVARAQRSSARAVVVLGLVLLAALFCYNKLAGRGEMLGALATQGTLAFLGISYFVLKAGAILIDAARGAVEAPGFLRLARWLIFLPIFPSGPIEDFKHFDVQEPVVDRDRILRGLERILFGCVRAVVFAQYLGDWAQPILTSPQGHPPGVLLFAAYAFTLRFYLDFAGYSDIAIGLAAVYGYDIQENFDNPLVRRNLAALWQRWHMTLTGWMRLYLFIPITRAIMRRGGARSHSFAIAAGHVAAMLFCGLWHGLQWEFALWGLCHSLGLIWISLAARPLGKRLPADVLGWWRRSRLAYAASCFLTFNAFSLINVIAAAPIATTCTYFTLLVGLQSPVAFGG
jgi:alginate O-acetyltransferase complex protein AlgI